MLTSSQTLTKSAIHYILPPMNLGWCSTILLWSLLPGSSSFATLSYLNGGTAKISILRITWMSRRLEECKLGFLRAKWNWIWLRAYWEAEWLTMHIAYWHWGLLRYGSLHTQQKKWITWLRLINIIQYNQCGSIPKLFLSNWTLYTQPLCETTFFEHVVPASTPIFSLSWFMAVSFPASLYLAYHYDLFSLFHRSTFSLPSILSFPPVECGDNRQSRWAGSFASSWPGRYP